MKKLIASGIVTLLVGCSTLYTSIVTVTQVRDSAMKELAKLQVDGKLSPETVVKVDAADVKYRQAAEVAAKALEAYKISGDKGQYVAALAAVKEAVVGIIDLLTPIAPTATTENLRIELIKAKTL